MKKENSDLTKLRNSLDKIDKQIISLLHKRVEIVQKVKKLKQSKNISIYHAEREKIIIDNLLKLNQHKFPDESLVAIYSEIFSVSRKIQDDIKIGFLGPEATYTHLAAQKTFGAQASYVPLYSIRDIFVELDSGHIDYGVVPIENSTEGVVGYTLDLLTDFNLFILNEIYLEISHNIVSKEKSLKNIKILYSHSQAIGQCRTFIENNLRNVKIIETSSTAEAAKRVLKKRHSAAIASKLAAQLYKLNILAEKINDNLNNYTRFLILGKIPNQMKQKLKYKTSLICGIKDKPGALFELLEPFRRFKINMSKIESRPTKKKAWEYMFFIDFIGKLTDKNVQKALKIIDDKTTYLKILGSYPAAKQV